MEFGGLLPRRVVDALSDLGNWQARAAAVEQLSRALAAARASGALRALAPRDASALAALVLRLARDGNFKVAAAGLDALGDLAAAAATAGDGSRGGSSNGGGGGGSAGGLLAPAQVEEALAAVAARLGDDKPGVRAAAARCARRLMGGVARPQAVLDRLAPLAAGAAGEAVTVAAREAALDVLIAALLACPLDGLDPQRIAATLLACIAPPRPPGGPSSGGGSSRGVSSSGGGSSSSSNLTAAERNRLQLIALDAFAALASRVEAAAAAGSGSGALAALLRGAGASELQAALVTQRALGPELPVLCADGSVRHSFAETSAAASASATASDGGGGEPGVSAAALQLRSHALCTLSSAGASSSTGSRVHSAAGDEGAPRLDRLIETAAAAASAPAATPLSPLPQPLLAPGAAAAAAATPSGGHRAATSGGGQAAAAAAMAAAGGGAGGALMSPESSVTAADCSALSSGTSAFARGLARDPAAPNAAVANGAPSAVAVAAGVLPLWGSTSGGGSKGTGAGSRGGGASGGGGASSSSGGGAGAPPRASAGGAGAAPLRPRLGSGSAGGALAALERLDLLELHGDGANGGDDDGGDADAEFAAAARGLAALAPSGGGAAGEAAARQARACSSGGGRGTLGGADQAADGGSARSTSSGGSGGGGGASAAAAARGAAPATSAWADATAALPSEAGASRRESLSPSRGERLALLKRLQLEKRTSTASGGSAVGSPASAAATWEGAFEQGGPAGSELVFPGAPGEALGGGWPGRPASWNQSGRPSGSAASAAAVAAGFALSSPTAQAAGAVHLPAWAAASPPGAGGFGSGGGGGGGSHGGGGRRSTCGSVASRGGGVVGGGDCAAGGADGEAAACRSNGGGAGEQPSAGRASASGGTRSALLARRRSAGELMPIALQLSAGGASSPSGAWKNGGWGGGLGRGQSGGSRVTGTFAFRILSPPLPLHHSPLHCSIPVTLTRSIPFSQWVHCFNRCGGIPATTTGRHHAAAPASPGTPGSPGASRPGSFADTTSSVVDVPSTADLTPLSDPEGAFR